MADLWKSNQNPLEVLAPKLVGRMFGTSLREHVWFSCFDELYTGLYLDVASTSFVFKKFQHSNTSDGTLLRMTITDLIRHHCPFLDSPTTKAAVTEFVREFLSAHVSPELNVEAVCSSFFALYVVFENGLPMEKYVNFTSAVEKHLHKKWSAIFQDFASHVQILEPEVWRHLYQMREFGDEEGQALERSIRRWTHHLFIGLPSLVVEGGIQEFT